MISLFFWGEGEGGDDDKMILPYCPKIPTLWNILAQRRENSFPKKYPGLGLLQRTQNFISVPIMPVMQKCFYPQKYLLKRLAQIVPKLPPVFPDLPNMWPEFNMFKASQIYLSQKSFVGTTYAFFLDSTLALLYASFNLKLYQEWQYFISLYPRNPIYLYL